MPLAAVALSLAALAFADNKPGEVHIAFGDDPKTTMSVVWQTATPTEAPTVRYGTSKANLSRTAKATRSRYAYETKAIAEAKLTGLQAGTTYYYRVGDKDAGWSQVFSFRTAPSTPQSWAFTAFGDHGISPDAIKNVANIVREKPAFHLLLGDVSYANGKQPIWDDYLAQIQPMAATIPYMPTLGNHEDEEMKIDGKEIKIGYVSYLARFALPQQETHYFFDYGDVRFVAFNSDAYDQPGEIPWLRKTLAEARANKKIRWTVVFQHHPPYGSSKGRDDNEGEVKALVPVFDEFKVDLVLCGHDHHYERQFPMRGGRPTSSAMSGYKKGVGTLYMVQGGGGKSLYDFSEPKPAICAYREKTTGYLRVTVVKGGSMTIEAKRIDGSLMEKIVIGG